MFNYLKYTTLGGLNYVFPELFSEKLEKVTAVFHKNTITILDKDPPINGEWFITGYTKRVIPKEEEPEEEPEEEVEEETPVEEGEPVAEGESVEAPVEEEQPVEEEVVEEEEEPVEPKVLLDDSAITYINRKHEFVDNVSTSDIAFYSKEPVEQEILISKMINVFSSISRTNAYKALDVSRRAERDNKTPMPSQAFIYLSDLESFKTNVQINQHEEADQIPVDYLDISVKYYIGFIFVFSHAFLEKNYECLNFNFDDVIIRKLINICTFQYDAEDYSTYLKFEELVKIDNIGQNNLYIDLKFSYISNIFDQSIINFYNTFSDLDFDDTKVDYNIVN